MNELSHSMPMPGFAVRDNMRIAPTEFPLTSDRSSTSPGTPTKAYEIGGWDVIKCKWQTLKYGVASTVYDTYGGIGNRRPDGQ